MCKHITVVLPNRPRQFYEVTKLLSDAGINVLGYTLVSEGRSGIVHLLCDDHALAFRTLEARYKHYCSEKEAIIVAVPHESGQLKRVIEIIADAEINLPNSYQAVTTKCTALLVMDFDSQLDLKRAATVLSENGVNLLQNMEQLK